MNFFYQPRLNEGVSLLEGDEAHHAINVLRLSVGDEIGVTDGKGLMVKALIQTKSGEFKIKESRVTTPAYSIHLFVAPTKNSDRMEWLVEKATEIGVVSISMMRCERSERKHINLERLMKVALSAMKQSQQSWLPGIHDVTFKEALGAGVDQKFIAFVDHTNPDHLKKLAKPDKAYAVLIGPEGDFTPAEIDLAIASSWKKVSLGPTRLRTETAALIAGLTLVLANN